MATIHNHRQGLFFAGVMSARRDSGASFSRGGMIGGDVTAVVSGRPQPEHWPLTGSGWQMPMQS
jgi:hypothetical protein